MKTQWDYTDLADAYIKRPDYSGEAINELFNLMGITQGQFACDIGAGVGHLTRHLLKKGLNVVALEPNDAMRRHGIERTAQFKNVTWLEAAAENTLQDSDVFRLVTFGSSFNVTDQQVALKETSRILKPDGWFACMWNHRNLDDAIQAQIEHIIKNRINDYDYGSRRVEQTSIIDESDLFKQVHKIEGQVKHTQSLLDCKKAWRSHATLQRQAGDHFENVIQEIDSYLDSLQVESITIPYTTRIWVAQKKSC
jgi:ubiquinone/menaquinone biosynthesis C-methylase UbiE